MAYAPHELVAKWRREAEYARESARLARASDTYAAYSTEARTLSDCAKELERYHHDTTHDAAWADGCPLCDKERRDND